MRRAKPILQISDEELKMSKVSSKTLHLIHFYNSDGFVHYVSEVVGRADCRVADVVRSLADITMESVGVLPSSVDPTLLERILVPGRDQDRFVEEAVRVSLALPTWLNNIWMNSPLRDSAIWTGVRVKSPGALSGLNSDEVRIVPGGLKATWETDRLRRRKAWEKHRQILPLGVSV
jgi:hypothetical protein